LSPTVMSFRALFAVAALVQLLSAPKGSVAQQSSVTCDSTYNWAKNSLGQDPCVVGSYLLRVCDTSNITIPTLPVGDNYNPGDTSPCNCNSVTYTLIAACADCQDGNFDTWSFWSENCTAPYDKIYPEILPAGTAVPGWAYLDVVGSNVYNATVAQQFAESDPPESTGIASSTPSSSASASKSSTSTGINFSSLFSPSSTANSAGGTAAADQNLSTHKSNAGPIAGGVIAGVVVLALVAALATWFCLRRSRARQVAPSAAYKANDPGMTYGAAGAGYAAGGYAQAPTATPPHSPPPMSQFSGQPGHYTGSDPYGGFVGGPGSTLTATPPPKLYDPADPSTFPTNQPMPSYPQGNNAGYGAHHPAPATGQYTGAPQV